MKYIKKYYGIFLCAFFILFLFFYVLVKKESIYIPVWDNLDSNITWLKMLKDNNLFWSFNTEVPFLNGIDRDYLYSDLHVYSWLYMLFSTFIAYVSGYFIKLIVSIVGMIFLGKEVFKDKYDINICALCGLLYGLVPSFPTSALSFSTLPIIFCVFIKLYKKFSWKYIIAIFFYPLFSDFFLFGIFLCGYILIFYIIDYIYTKKPKNRFLLALFVLSIGFVMSEWRLFNALLFSNNQSLRSVDFLSKSNDSLFLFVKDIFDGFINSTLHVKCFHKYIILPTIFIYIIVKIINGKSKDIIKNGLLYIILLLLANSVIYGLDSYAPFINFINNFFPVLRGFSFSRTIWFNSFLWIFAFLIVVVDLKNKYLKYSLYSLALLIIILGDAPYNVLRLNLKQYKNIYFNDEITDLSYEEFYSEELFDEIKKDLEYNNEWSVAFGMHPAILEYNGIYTIDGYLSYYSAEYKNKFEKVIYPELEIDPTNKAYFDSWGGRAYIYSKEVSYWTYEYNYDVEKANMIINIDALRDMNCKYIFSRVRISNEQELGIKYIGKYSNDSSKYVIYVYEC